MRKRASAVLVVAALLAGACSPFILPSGPDTAQPGLAMPFFTARDGMKLPYRAWLPDTEPAAIIVGVHGFNDHSGTFTRAAPFWAKSGISVYAYDQRGFGGGIPAGVWAGRDRMARDLRDFTETVRAAHPGAPLYLVGVSMGGAVVMHALTGPEAERPAATGVVLVAPAVWGRDTMPVAYSATLWAAAHSLPWMKLSGQSLNRVPSDNTEMLRELGRDPRVIKRTRVDAIWGLVNLMDASYAAAPRQPGPILLLYGAKDEIVPPAPIIDVHQRMKPAARLVLYPRGYHMLLRDLQAKTVWRDIAAWIADRDAPLPSGADTDAAVRLKALAN